MAWICGVFKQEGYVTGRGNGLGYYHYCKQVFALACITM